MTSSPSDTEATVDSLQVFAESAAEAVGGEVEIQFDTVKLRVPADEWVNALTTARDDLDLVFFSWLSAIDWSNDVEAGDGLNEETEERIELLCTVCDLTEGRRITFSTDLPNVMPSVASIVEVYVGANWHEREAAEMFGIVFEGHPDPGPLYLPESFVGNPLKKSYPLLSREVKPWPGTVDVEAMPEQPSTQKPSTENPGV